MINVRARTETPQIIFPPRRIYFVVLFVFFHFSVFVTRHFIWFYFVNGDTALLLFLLLFIKLNYLCKVGIIWSEDCWWKQNRKWKFARRKEPRAENMKNKFFFVFFLNFHNNAPLINFNSRKIHTHHKI